jgi:hypothetical protein
MAGRKPFTLIAAVIFALMALVHCYRLIDPFPVTIHGQSLGQGPSIVALLITGLLSFGLFREARR